MKRVLLLLLAVVAMAADPPLERARPEPAPASMSAGAAVLDEAFTQAFADERQPERVTLRYAQESWELDWDDWWAYRQGEIDLEGLVAKVRIRAEGAAVAAKPAAAGEARPEPGRGSVPVAWGVAGVGMVVVLVTGALLWFLMRKKEPRRTRTPRAAPPPLPPPPVPTRLCFHSGPLAGQSVLLGQGLRLGREKDCHVVVEDPSVSRHHADLVPSPQGWVLRDLGSSNGTCVNGVRIQGDVLLRGDEALAFGFVRASLTGG